MLIIKGTNLPAMPLLRLAQPGIDPEASTPSDALSAECMGQFSATARQLSQAATRAAEQHTPPGLEANQNMHELLQRLTGATYQANKARHDTEQPASPDADLQARARQATDFSNGLGSNPFKGMPCEQLRLIMHDDSSLFTINERRAACLELQHLKQVQQARLITSRNDQGHDLMVSRLFDGHEPPVRPKTHGLLREMLSVHDVEFLTAQDRNLLTHIYAYAQGQGAHLKYVDDLAWDIASYRRHDDGWVLANINGGHTYDGQGRQLSFSFTPANAVIAQRTLEGTAINSTLLDKAFVRFNLDPENWAYHNGGDLGFLEQIVTRFGAESHEDYALDDRFKTYTRDPKVKDKVVHASATIRFQTPPEPCVINKEGVWTITETGKAAGYVLNPITGVPHQMSATVEASAETKAPGSPFADLIGSKPDKSRLLTLFDYVFMKMKTQGRVRRP